MLCYHKSSRLFTRDGHKRYHHFADEKTEAWKKRYLSCLGFHVELELEPSTGPGLLGQNFPS